MVERLRSTRLILACTYLVFQLVVLGYSLVRPSTYFRWAPFDIQAEYWVRVEIDGRGLTDEQVEERYRQPPVGIESHSIEHLQVLIEQYEQTYGRQDGAKVLMNYRINGGEMEQWRWPRQ